MKAAFEPWRIDKHQLHPLKDYVIVSDMSFEGRKLSSGIILPNDDGKMTGIRARWAEVYAVGPDQKELRPGQWVCVAHGRWTRGVEIQDETGKHTIRRVDFKDILLTSDTPVADDTISDKELTS